MAAARKFTEAQIFFLESEFNKGLASTSMTKYGDRFRYLKEKTGLPIEIIQRWINNRSRGPRPTCFRPNNVNEDVDMESEESRRPANSNTETRCFKKAPSTKSATGYAVFCGEVFRERKDEFKGMSLHDKNKHAHSMWQELPKEEQKRYKEKAKQNSNRKVKIEEVQGKARERLIRQSIQRIQAEMDFLDQFGCTGFALIPNTPDGLVFPDLPHTPDYSQDDIRRLLNEKYRKFTGTLKRVEYEKFNSSFVVKGWSENVPFMQPGRFSQKRINAVMEAMPGIGFENVQENIAIVQEANDSSTTEIQETDEAFLPDHNDAIEAAVASTVIDAQCIHNGKAKKFNAKKLSFVRKGNVVPVIPSPEDSEDKLFLFICGGKAKTNNIIKGKWLIKCGDRDFVKSRDEASVLESNVYVKDGQRPVLREEDFEINEAGFYRLTIATARMIEALHDGLKEL